MRKNKLLYLAITVAVVGIVIFSVLRFVHYSSMRKDGHDSFQVVVPKGSAELCPRLEMFGFKYSSLLFLWGINTVILMYLVLKN